MPAGKEAAKRLHAGRPCDRCKRRPSVRTLRYCRACRRHAIAQMARSGYLQWVPQSVKRHSNPVSYWAEFWEQIDREGFGLLA